MTWDVYAFKAPPGTRQLDDLSPSHLAGPVGTAEGVLAVIREGAPHVDASDPTWLVLEGDDHSLDVSVGKGVVVADLTFYIRGGQGSVALVLDLCRRLGVRGFDTETGEMLMPSSTPPSFDLPDDEDDEVPKRRWWQRR